MLDEDYAEDEDFNFDDYESHVDDSPQTTCLQYHNVSDVGERIDALLVDALATTSLPSEVVMYLFCRTKWDITHWVQEWLETPEAFLDKHKLSHAYLPGFKIPNEPEGPFTCPIFFSEYPMEETTRLGCGHRLSNEGWEGILKSAVSEGKSSAFCPINSCGTIVPPEMWRRFLDPEVYAKFKNIFYINAIDSNPKMSRCVSATCSLVIEDPTGTQSDITCNCGEVFCFRCALEPHRPVPCKIIGRWLIKNQDESENVAWIIVNTKSCPGCNKPIEKNQGCMHITCKCGFQFCWVCLKEWRNHTAAYHCNGYETARESPSTAKTRIYLDKYHHYYERYHQHENGQKLAMAQRLDLRDAVIQLTAAFGEMTSSSFLFEANERVIECRRTLKWSYAFAYYMDWTNTPNQKILFEDFQGTLERSLDNLHSITEKFSLDRFIGDEVQSYQVFFQFKQEAVNQTHLVQNVFEKMTEAMETEFENVPTYNDALM